MTTFTPTMSWFNQELAAKTQADAPEAATQALANETARRLVLAVGRGDEQAFRELYHLYCPRLSRLALVLSHGDMTIAQDAVQMTMIVAAQKLRRTDSETHLWNWLALITRQQVGKIRRQQQKNSSEVVMEELPPTADASAADHQLENHLDAALTLMEAEDRQLVEWFYFDRLGHADIAEKLNLTPKAVSSRLERARAKLRTLMTRKLSHET
jgi:RNA polymerase sigma factor (sigma-70 family)